MYYENADRQGDTLTIACADAADTFMVVLE